MMKHLLIILLAMLSVGCTKSSKTEDDMKRNLTVSIVDYTPPNLGNHYWAVNLQLDKSVIMAGNIIVQHDLWDLGQFKKTYIDTFDFSISNSNFFKWPTKRNSTMQGPEIKNIKVNRFTQVSGNYDVIIK